MIQSMDLNSDGRVSFDEFLLGYTSKASRAYRGDYVDDVTFSNQMHIKRDRATETLPGSDVSL